MPLPGYFPITSNRKIFTFALFLILWTLNYHESYIDPRRSMNLVLEKFTSIVLVYLGQVCFMV